MEYLFRQDGMAFEGDDDEKIDREIDEGFEEDSIPPAQPHIAHSVEEERTSTLPTGLHSEIKSNDSDSEQEVSVFLLS